MTSQNSFQVKNKKFDFTREEIALNNMISPNNISECFLQHLWDFKGDIKNIYFYSDYVAFFHKKIYFLDMPIKNNARVTQLEIADLNLTKPTVLFLSKEALLIKKEKTTLLYYDLIKGIVREINCTQNILDVRISKDFNRIAIGTRVDVWGPGNILIFDSANEKIVPISVEDRQNIGLGIGISISVKSEDRQEVDSEKDGQGAGPEACRWFPARLQINNNATTIIAAWLDNFYLFDGNGCLLGKTNPINQRLAKEKADDKRLPASQVESVEDLIDQMIEVNISSHRALYIDRIDFSDEDIIIAQGGYIFKIGKDGELLWQFPKEYVEEPSCTYDFKVSPSSEYILAVSREGEEEVSCLSSNGELLWQKKMPDISSYLGNICFSQDEHLIAFTTREENLHIFDISGRELFKQKFKGSDTKVKFYNDLLVLLDSRLRLYKINS